MKKSLFIVSVLALFFLMTIVVTAYTNSFLDKDSFADWYEEDVDQMRSTDIIRGYPDGEFKPYNNVNRAELAVILNRFARAGQIKLADYSSCDLTDQFEAGLEFRLQDISGNPISGIDIEIDGPDSYFDYNDFAEGEAGYYVGLVDQVGHFVIEINKEGYSSYKESLDLKMDEAIQCYVLTQYRTITLIPSVD